MSRNTKNAVFGLKLNLRADKLAYPTIEIFFAMCGLHKSQREDGVVCDPNIAQNVALHWGRKCQQELHKIFPEIFKKHQKGGLCAKKVLKMIFKDNN